MKNRYDTWIILAMIAITLFGCSTEPQSNDPVKITVVATTTIVGDVVRNIGGEHITLTVLLPTGADPHAFEPQPVDLARVADADLVFANGAGLETFLDSMIQNAGGDATIVEVSEGLALLRFEDQHQAEPDAESHGEFDPHVWDDPTNVMIWVENISQTLQQIDPAHTTDYRQNAEQYTKQLQELDARIQEIVSVVPVEKRLLVTDHLIFGYFARRYGFTVVESIIQGFSTLSSPSAQELAALQDQIRQSGIPAIFVGVSVNPSLAEQIAKDTGVQMVRVYTGALSEPGQPGATYLEMMEYNAQAIADALK